MTLPGRPNMPNLSERTDARDDPREGSADGGRREKGEARAAEREPGEADLSLAALGGVAMAVPAQAILIGAMAWLRYSGAVVEAWARYQTDLGAARGPSQTQSRALADDTRAFLRRIGEAASLEARRAQIELDQIGEQVAGAAAAAEGAFIDPDRRVRRHEAKA